MLNIKSIFERHNKVKMCNFICNFTNVTFTCVKLSNYDYKHLLFTVLQLQLQFKAI